MDYVNPVSIAQMAQVPKDTNLPGTGYGLVQGFNEGQAMARSKDFLDMARASQAQNYVKNQFDMQTAWEDYPINRLRKEAELAQTNAATDSSRQQTARSKWDVEKARDDAKKANVFGHLGILAASRDKFKELRGKPLLEQEAYYNSVRNQLDRLGYPIDEDLHFDKNNAETSWDNLIKYSDMAHEITTYDNETRRAIAGQAPRLRSAEEIAAKDRQSRENMNDTDNVGAYERAKLALGREGRGMTQAEAMKDLREEYRIAKRREMEGLPLSTDQKVLIQEFPRLYSPGYGTAADMGQNPQVQGDITAAKERAEYEEFERWRKNKGKKGTSSDVIVKPRPDNNIKADPLEDDITNRLKRYERQ